MLSSNDDIEIYSGDKKIQKRAANRLSAQLSRKRKKQFMEELKDENDDLKRKEQILKSIPDLIVVFDSSGKLWFVSESVSRFLQFSAKELEGTSIWERLCDDSVRLLKAAFMDSLAARDQDSDTAPLGSGFWELRLVDRDGSQQIVTLNGVVHFAGERPECVCSIRPSDEPQYNGPHATASKSDDPKHDIHYKSLIRIKPHQSVMSSSSSDSSSSRRKLKRANHHGKQRDTMRISNSENSSESNSETGSGSGSSDE
jgi:PAS domain S-box-containing protein